MRCLLRFTLLVILAVPVMFVASCGPDKSEYPVQIRSDFAESASQVVGLIEKGHNRQLEVGKDEPPNFAVDRLRTYAHNSDETFLVDRIYRLSEMMYEHWDNEYYQCDAEIRQILHSRLMPNVIPGCEIKLTKE